MKKILRELLKKLESELNFDDQDKIEAHHKKALEWQAVNRPPLIASFPYPLSHPIQPFPHREIFDDPEKMLFNELVHAFDTSIFLHSGLKDDLTYTIRANFGTVIIASLFGGRIEQRADNPPWVRHFETLEEFKTIFEKDPLDFSQGVCPQVIERYKFYRDVFAGYPNLHKCVKIVLPDLQGPVDTLEQLRGSTVFEDFIMKPDMVDKGLQLITQAQVGLAKHLQQFITDEQNSYSHQHVVTLKGNILIRNDSAIMISPEMYSEQLAGHDEFVLKEMGGGGIHACGRIDFSIPEIFKLPSIKSFDFGQSYLNNIEMVYELAKEKKIPLIRVRAKKNEILSGKIKKMFPTGVSLVYDADSFDEAKKIIKFYKEN
jgi:hypothetical protein